MNTASRLLTAGADAARSALAKGRRLAGSAMTGPAERTLGRARGTAYRVLRRRPDPDVSDDVLADRIRSTIGPLEKELQVPRVNITVESGVAILHGDVSRLADAEAIESAVRAVSGVVDVQSHLKY